jgi:hypothetical protein
MSGGDEMDLVLEYMLSSVRGLVQLRPIVPGT